MIDEKTEVGEAIVDAVIEDAKQVIALMERKSGKKASEMKIIVAEDWKRKLVNAVAKEKDVGKAMDSLKDEKGVNKENAAKIAASLAKKMNEVREVTLMQQEEFGCFDEAKDYIGKQLNCGISVEKESASRSERAGRAMPMKPSLDIVFA